ncbi:MAG: hypothetical protein HY354_01045, partial [Planctomycetes bacterium]|nr:hypothetical protein [Planctomycetota bacterium]
MHQLFIVIPVAVFVIALVVFVLYRRRTRAGKSEGVTQKREYFRADVLEPEAFIVIIELDAGSLTGCRLMNISIG